VEEGGFENFLEVVRAPQVHSQQGRNGSGPEVPRIEEDMEILFSAFAEIDSGKVGQIKETKKDKE
jgi:hypothetical protein